MLSLLRSFDNKLIPYGSTIIFQLHKTDDYFVKIYYFNDIYKELPNLLKIGICDLQEQCPLNKFQQRIKTFYVRNYDEEDINVTSESNLKNNFNNSKIVEVPITRLPHGPDGSKGFKVRR